MFFTCLNFFGLDCVYILRKVGWYQPFYFNFLFSDRQTFLHRHDKVKTVLNRLCLACEVFGAFKDPIPVNALEQEDEGLQRGRGRHGLLTDFRLELPSTQGEPTYRLADLKTIGAVPKWYPSSGAWRGEV